MNRCVDTNVKDGICVFGCDNNYGKLLKETGSHDISTSMY